MRATVQSTSERAGAGPESTANNSRASAPGKGTRVELATSTGAEMATSPSLAAPATVAPRRARASSAPAQRAPDWSTSPGLLAALGLSGPDAQAAASDATGPSDADAAPLADALAAARARLDRPAYRYLRPFAAPLLAQLEHGDPTPAARQPVLAELEALFDVSHSPDGAGRAEAKRASNAHHAALGERLASRLATAPKEGQAPEVALTEGRALAPQLGAEVAPELEDGVAATVEVIGVDDNQLEAAITIAPNDWRTRAKVAVAALVLVGGVAVWTWRRHRGGQAEPRDVGRAPEAPAPIRGGVNHNQDCFLLAVLQMIASAYAPQIDPAPDLINHDREALRQAVRLALPDLDADGAGLDADRVALLRSLMLLNHVVDSLDQQEDAGETFRRLMFLLRPQVAHGTRTATSVGRRDTRQIEGSSPAAEFDDEPPADPTDYGRAGRHERDSVEDGLYIPVNAGTGLIDYLGRTCGGGVVEVFDPVRTGNHEWARQHGAVVSITAVRVSQHFTQLPDVLPITVQRWRNDLTRDPRAFAMPETFTLPVHGGRWPVLKTYRLQALVHHRGETMHGGHYWAHRRVGERWLRADDDRISEDRQSATPEAPAEGELPHDVDHGYLYTYVLQSEREAWWAGDATGQPLDASTLPPPAEPAHHAAPIEPAHAPPTRTVDAGGQRSHGLRGGPARAAPAPDFEKARALLPISDQFDFGDELEKLVDLALPRVLHAYSVDMTDPKLAKAKAPQPTREISLMHAGAATALIENLVIWWMVLHPSETRQGLERIGGYLWHHVDDTVNQLLHERGQRDLGALEEDEGGTEDSAGRTPAKAERTEPAPADADRVAPTKAVVADAPSPAATPSTTAVAPTLAATNEPAVDAVDEVDKVDEVDDDDSFDLFGHGFQFDSTDEEQVDDKGVPHWLRNKRLVLPKDPTAQAQGVEPLGDHAYPRLCVALDQRHAQPAVQALLKGWLAEETMQNVPVVALLERALGGHDVELELVGALSTRSAQVTTQVTEAIGPLGVEFDHAKLRPRSTHDRSDKTPQEQALPLWLWASEDAGHKQLVPELVKRADDEPILALMKGPLQKGAAAVALASELAAALSGRKTGSELFQALASLLRQHGLRGGGRELVVRALGLLAPGHKLTPEELDELLHEPVQEELHVDAVLQQAQQEGWITKHETEQLGAKLGRRALAGILARALKGGDPTQALSSKLPGTRAMIEAVGSTGERAALGPPLTARSLMVDTNLVDVLLKPREQLDPPELEVREQVEAMMREHNIADLRLTNMNLGETFQHGALIGTAFLLEVDHQVRAIPWYGVPLSPEVDHRGAYADVFDKLEERSVGEVKGHADRSMIADAFCAQTEVREGNDKTTQRMVPHYATADEGILKPLSGFAKGKDAKPLDHRRMGDVPDFFAYLEQATGARRFRAEIEGRALQVHAIRKAKPAKVAKPKVEAPKVATKPPASAHPFDQYVLGEHTVRELIELIRGQGYDAVISGGAVRDVVRGKQPNDIDLKANIPHVLLERELRTTWGATAIAIVPDLRLLQIGEIDVMCGEPDARPGPLDRGEAAAKADFRMNALQLALGEGPSDPLAARGDDVDGVADAANARLTFVADPGPKATGEARQRAVVTYLTREPWVLGRTLKFLARGYELHAAMLDTLRDHAVEILTALHLRERALEEKALLLHKCEVSSPEELVLLLRRFQFTPEAIRLVLPDSVAGRHGDGGESFERSVMPRNRGIDEAEATWDPRRPPQLKVDVETGRIYQYRVCAVLPRKDRQPRGNRAVATEDKVILDVDCSNHDISGHPSPHYHVYRWLGGRWDKKQSGLSSTGQPGTPPLDDGVFLGPTPWRWIEEVPARGVAEALVGKLAGTLAIAIADDVVTLGTQLRVHRLHLEQLHAAGQLTKLLLMVHNLDAGIAFDPDEQLAKDLTGSHKGQHRLRFTSQVVPAVDAFLRRCKVETHARFHDLDDAGRQRLHDLAASSPREEVCGPAATWALKAPGTVAEFVQRFEFFLTVAGAGSPPADEVVDAALEEGAQAVDEAGMVAAVQVDRDGEEPAQVRGAAARLGFASVDAATYHVRKHAAGHASVREAAPIYLAAARATVALSTEVVVTPEVDGSLSVVCWRGHDKAVVRVAADGATHLLTFFTKGL